MGTYTKHNGIQLDTAEMPLRYIENALSKAEEEKDDDNINALTKELSLRENNDGTII